MKKFIWYNIYLIIFISFIYINILIRFKFFIIIYGKSLKKLIFQLHDSYFIKIIWNQLFTKENTYNKFDICLLRKKKFSPLISYALQVIIILCDEKIYPKYIGTFYYHKKELFRRLVINFFLISLYTGPNKFQIGSCIVNLWNLKNAIIE